MCGRRWRARHALALLSFAIFREEVERNGSAKPGTCGASVPSARFNATNSAVRLGFPFRTRI